jgi:conjugal transfer pilus assembly protein TraF
MLLMLFIVMNTGVFADDKGYFSENARGWYWHDEYKEQRAEDNNEEKKQAESDPVEQLNAIRDTIERAKAQAVINPTKENVKNYINIQNQLGEHSQQFERTWKEVLLENPELDYSLKHPTNNLAKRVELDQNKEKEEAVIYELAKKSGLFFFYRSSCPYCVHFAPIVKDFAETYGITVIPITTDGVALPEFPNSYPDRGQAEKFHVTVEPALFAVNPYTHKAFPVAYGLTSEADLKKRLLDIATRFGGV